MARLNNITVWMCWLFFLCACTQKKNLSPEEYLRFAASERCGLNAAKSMNHITFRCRLQTPELIALQRTGGHFKSLQEFEQGKKEHTKQLNVTFLIEDESPSDHQVKEVVYNQASYGELLAYANTLLQHDISLQLPNGEEIPCSLVHVEPANSIRPVIRISAAFYNLDESLNEYSLVFDDNLFNNGKIKFHYGPDVFNALPNLNL